MDAVAPGVDAPGQATAPRVLVADGEDDIRSLVCLAVRKAGCTVAASVADADAYLPEPFGVGALVTPVPELVA